MEDILELPTAVFELYPRIRVALEAHSAGEHYALYGPLNEMPELSDALKAAEAAHEEIDAALAVLNRVPFRKQQIDSQQWKETFRLLHRMVLDHLDKEDDSRACSPHHGSMRWAT